MAEEQSAIADSSAVRVALWRAMHVQVDAPPHVLDDEIGLQLAASAGVVAEIARLTDDAYHSAAAGRIRRKE